MHPETFSESARGVPDVRLVRITSAIVAGVLVHHVMSLGVSNIQLRFIFYE